MNRLLDRGQIIKNATFLYIRKGFSIVVGLYTARLLLNALGETDYGLYGVVGSVVIMFNSLRFIFTDSIQRFINVAKGDNDNNKIRDIFSVGIMVQLLLAIIFIICCEIGGYFILPNLNVDGIPFWQIQILFQLSILSSIISLMTVPYDALIIANEKFNIYAVLSIFDVTLRLLAVILLFYFSAYRVLWYAVFILLISVIIRVSNAVYCRYTFKTNAKYHHVRDKSILKDMTKFAGWNFFGNFGYWSTYSGLDFILNHFGGLLINASRSISNQVFNAFQSFIGDMNTSFRPRSMRLYAQGEITKYYNLMFLNSRTNFFICSVLGFTLITNMSGILGVWLGSIPPTTTIFCKCIVLYTMIRSIRGPIDIYIKAIGHLKIYQLAECGISILNLPLSFIFLYNGFPLFTVYIVMIVLEIINLSTIIVIANIRYGFKVIPYVKNVISRIILTSIILIVIYKFYRLFIPDTTSLFLQITITGLISIIISSLTLYESTERKHIYHVLIKRL